MSSSNPSRSITVVLLQLTAFSVPSPSVTYFLSIQFQHQDEIPYSSDCELSQISSSTSTTVFRSNFKFSSSYQFRDPTDSLIFTFSAQFPNAFQPLATVSIPISYLPLNQQIVESFQMDLLTASDVIPRIFLKICDHLTSLANPFGQNMPFGIVTVRERPVDFMAGHISQEFSVPKWERSETFLLFSSENLGEVVKPPAVSMPIVYLEEEEEEEEEIEIVEDAIVSNREREKEEMEVEVREDKRGEERNFSFFPTGEQTLCVYRRPPPLDFNGDYD
jgi:hypothetical protein